MPGKPPEEGTDTDESHKHKEKASKISRFEWLWEESPITRIIEKIFLGLVFVFCVYLITIIFINPDFYITPSVPSVTIKTFPGEKFTVNQEFYINANDVYEWAGFKKYRYPIFICCDMIDSQGKPIQIPDVKVSIEPKNINTSGRSKVTISLENQSIQKDIMNLRFHGRGCGENIILREGPFSTLELSPSGIEPMRNCTVTIEIERGTPTKIATKEAPQNKKEKFSELMFNKSL